jgi:short-subunit dehydrogenase
MKIILTGHTKGLGKALADVFSSNGHNVLGFSRTTGHDISIENAREEILDQLQTADVFINNAYDPVGQTLLLEKSLDIWNKKDKFIINIGSKCTTAFFNEIENLYVKNFILKYTEEKLKQEQLIKSKLRFSLPRVLNVIPGIINTSMSELITGDRLQPKQIAELTYQMFSIRHAVLVQELTLDSPNSDWSTIKFLI